MKTTIGNKIIRELKKTGIKTTAFVIKPTKEDRIKHKEVTRFINTMDKVHKAAGKSKERYGVIV